MKSTTIIIFFFFSLVLLLQICILEVHGGGVGGASLHEMEVMKMGKRKTAAAAACTGKMGLCFWSEEEDADKNEEMQMDSESNRRILMVQKRYISYETLKKDVVPCARPGASYYDCHVMGHANPYNRGCEVIAGCRNNN